MTRAGGNHKITKLRRLEGDVLMLRHQLVTELDLPMLRVQVNAWNKNILVEVSGLLDVEDKLEAFLVAKGF
ncbi:MAG: hypothetical protein M1826_001437 [Phylliscum demangeonii]|nr:MAG: hypothetical protein M1826_001437 [Phylliscum demangeonii]